MPQDISLTYPKACVYLILDISHIIKPNTSPEARQKYEFNYSTYLLVIYRIHTSKNACIWRASTSYIQIILVYNRTTTESLVCGRRLLITPACLSNFPNFSLVLSIFIHSHLCCLSVWFPVCLSVYLYICLSVSRSFYLHIYLCFFSLWRK